MTERTTVIIPTYNEGKNVAPLLRRLTDNLHVSDQVIFIDDGNDNLPQIVAQEQRQYLHEITVVRRTSGEGGLGGAVTYGFTIADGDVIVVCDGDLQHPPEVIPELVSAARRHDIVVASRYIQGGNSSGLEDGWRQFASVFSSKCSKALFPNRLRGCTDPMSGFFAVRKSIVDVQALRPSGFKILLEILLRSERKLEIREVPFCFASRQAGESHASFKEGRRFLAQLVRARLMNRALGFILVGASGIVPNLTALYILTQMGMHFILATLLATQLAIVWNFVGAEAFVWRDHRLGQWERRFLKFLLIGETDLLRLPFVIILVSGLGLHSVVASAITLAGAFLFRFSLADKIVYRRSTKATAEEVANVDA